MERFLQVVEVAHRAGGESLLGTIKIAVLPIAKVFTVCSLGLLMASKYVNIFPASGRKLLNGLVFSLLLPCLIFSQLGQAITLQKMLEWWFIPVNVVLGSTSGSIIGYIVASIVRPPYPFFKFTIVQIGIGNIGNVPLVLISALCRDKSNPFGDSTTCKTDGTAYISFGQWVGAIILYTYVFHMLAPPPEGTFDIEEGELPIKNPRNGKIPDQVPLLTHDENEEAAHEEEVAETNSNVSHTPKIIDFLVFLYEKLKLKQLLQPPIIASILAMVLKCPIQVCSLAFSILENDKKVRSLKKEVDALLLKLVRDRQAESQLCGTSEKDLLQMILESAASSTEMPSHKTDQFILDNCRTIYFAGSETTALAASWTLMLLALQPEWQDRVRAEIFEVCGDDDQLHHCLQDMDTLRKLKMLTMVIQESLRLYGPGVIMAREALTNMKLGDLDVPEGIHIWTFIPALHRDPENWGSDADEFKPERFENGVSESCKYPQAYMPFGYGSRLCMGQTFAMLQLKIVLSLILSKFSFSLSPNYQHCPVYKILLLPQHGIKLLVRRVQ